MTGPIAPPPSSERISALIAWRNALGIAALLWLVVGLANLGFLARFLATTMRHQLLLAALLLDIGFAVAIGVVVAAIVLWQHAHGESLSELGWRRPTTRPAVTLAVAFGALWVALSYARGGNPLAITWERPLMVLIGLFLAFGEELAMRGFFMESLRRGGVPTWLQVIASGVSTGSYHGIVGLSYSPAYAIVSTVLFSVVAVLFVMGRRSLTPGYTAHAMTHVFGDPTLTLGILHGILLHR
jgi:Type II CAAX prenyl endopeptidase Rce1-like